MQSDITKPALATIVTCFNFSPENFFKSDLTKLGQIHFVFRKMEDVNTDHFDDFTLHGEYVTARIINTNIYVYIFFQQLVTERIEADYFVMVNKDIEVRLKDNFVEKIKDKVYFGWYGDYLLGDKYEYVKELYPPYYVIKSEPFTKYGLDAKKHGVFYKEKDIVGCLTKK